MTGRRRTRSTFLRDRSGPRGPLGRPGRSGRSGRVRSGTLAAGALLACVSLTAGCGVVPGATGGGGDAPVTVMTWAPEETGATNKPGMPALALAYARWVNAHGGLNGRPLNVLTCNERNDNVSAAKCARRAVEEGAVAVVGSYSQYPDSFMTVLEGAGIPYIGGYGVTGAEFTSPLSYPVNGGQPTLLAGLGDVLARDCGPVALIRPDTLAGDRLPALLDSGLTSGGHGPAHDERAAEDATAYDHQAEQALRRTTDGARRPGCVVPVLGDRTVTFMDSFRRAGRDRPGVRTATVLGSADQTAVNASGGASGPYEGSYIAGWYPVVSDPRWEGMKRVIREQAFGDNAVDPADAGVQTTWIAYSVLREAVESLGGGEVTAHALTRALNDGLKIDTGGLTPTLRWRFQERLAAVGLPRLVNTEVTLQVVREGKLVSARAETLDTTAILRDGYAG
ncbi:ABC transporter substrate-binding protein [Streptomyces sp. SID8352]|uniref:ABC transporter substrate-binding protein n=1 Tax=Streptomyces sp. SID8352 TaxID=2690338 RepID=UPI0013720ED4|nr:ABC transporter substrate-binding protein [Streptomyces sp. SID8352]MYU20386.1 ABC transporter substrate-binding protein [Streptomyces sp. SID8352]